MRHSCNLETGSYRVNVGAFEMVTSCGMAPSSRRIERIYQNESNQLLLFVISFQPNTVMLNIGNFPEGTFLILLRNFMKSGQSLLLSKVTSACEYWSRL